MSQVRETPWNGLNIVSTFSGCGGTCLGYKMAGFRVLWASEFVGAAREVYALNHPDTILDERDIRSVEGRDVLSAIKMKVGEIDILEGSPPCSAFSTAGKMEESWHRTNRYSDTAQRTDDLFWEFARLVDQLQPKVFVAENVSGLVRGVSKGYFKQIYRILQDCGYRVDARLLDASWLGVPQARRRLFIQGIRRRLESHSCLSYSLGVFSITSAMYLPHIRKMKLGGGKQRWSLPGRPFSTICQSDFHIGVNASLSTRWVGTH
jgi:DNA (cytosine-5)-methyltransferase 1